MQPGFDVQPLVRQFKALVMRALGGDAAAARQTLGAMGVGDPYPYSSLTGKPTTLTGAGYSSSDPLLCPVGAVIDFGGETPPSGWLECDGSSLLRASYPALFAAIGTLHGAADGTHFNLPDHRGKFKRGWDHGTANDPDAAGRTAAATGGATGDHVGTTQASAMQSHYHDIRCNSTTGSGTGGGGNFVQDAGVGALEKTRTTGTSSVFTTETRPTNVSVMSIIKF